MPSTLNFLFWFLIVLALIPLALWMLKRSQLVVAAGVAPPARVVASAGLGPQQRLVTIEVGQGEARQWLVLGVTPHTITVLHSLPPQELPGGDGAASAGLPATFATLLKQARRKP
ncbi:FliO/MopB family protein [Caldimonas aquatica]|uniref:Flagellar biosynthetic protein FliO n=1 Tax=Caldimonas aquatica TaxID=376175 RepID=A0ABY6MUP5_9BURK|nr:flagellar biosynthetic protein FliO [Schlegelella aquatica]UZD55726.1 flagellar biosynthetic protein FliO [Schlegelella aquatica]